MLTFNGKTFNNWKEYIDFKFSDRALFNVEQFNEDNNFIFSYRIAANDENCKTEIIVQLFKENEFAEVFDIHFNHPDSPVWTDENKKNNNYGWDGQGSSFTIEHLIDTDEWIDVALYHGWIETTYYFDNKEIKTEADWQHSRNSSTTLRQNYLTRYGCLAFPIVPFVIWYKSWYWERHPERMKKIKRTIPAMFPRVTTD